MLPIIFLHGVATSDGSMQADSTLLFKQRVGVTFDLFHLILQDEISFF